jgi:hypothetical protein
MAHQRLMMIVWGFVIFTLLDGIAGVVIVSGKIAVSEGLRDGSVAVPGRLCAGRRQRLGVPGGHLPMLDGKACPVCIFRGSSHGSRRRFLSTFQYEFFLNENTRVQGWPVPIIIFQRDNADAPWLDFVGYPLNFCIFMLIPSVVFLALVYRHRRVDLDNRRRTGDGSTRAEPEKARSGD